MQGRKLTTQEEQRIFRAASAIGVKPAARMLGYDPKTVRRILRRARP